MTELAVVVILCFESNAELDVVPPLGHMVANFHNSFFVPAVNHRRSRKQNPSRLETRVVKIPIKVRQG